MTKEELKKVGFLAVPPINNIEKNAAYKIVETFLSNEYWKEEYDDLYDPEIVVEYPYAPPGMLQYMHPYFFKCHRIWLNEVMSNWKLYTAPTIIPIDDGENFWAIRFFEADMKLGLKDCKYVTEVVTRIRVKNDKIVYLCEFERPTSYYDAMGIGLPAYHYRNDVAENPPCFRMQEGEVSKFTPEQNKTRAINLFANPITGYDGDPESCWAPDVEEGLPFAAYDQPHYTSGIEFDRNIEWMFRACPVWNSIEKPYFYQSVDPNVFIVEALGYGPTKWVGKDGHYYQREIQIVQLNDQGKIQHARIYFNALNKYNSMNMSIMTIPYFNY